MNLLSSSGNNSEDSDSDEEDQQIGMFETRQVYTLNIKPIIRTCYMNMLSPRFMNVLLRGSHIKAISLLDSAVRWLNPCLITRKCPSQLFEGVRYQGF